MAGARGADRGAGGARPDRRGAQAPSPQAAEDRPARVATYVDISSTLEFSVHVDKANFSGGPVSDCYKIKITAKNGHGKTVRKRHAGRQGTSGCKSTKKPPRADRPTPHREYS